MARDHLDDVRVGGGLADAMVGDGVDLSDPAAIDQWVNEFNARSFDERAAVLSGDVIDGLAPLPAVEVPAEDLARGSAAESALLTQCRLLVDFVADGRKLTETGNVTLADARQLVAALGTGDRIDETIGDRTFRTRSAADLPQLGFIVRVATGARFVRVVKGRLVATKAGRQLGRDPLADLERLVTAIDDLGMVTARTAGGRFAWTSLAPFFDDLFVPMASLLLTAARDVPFDEIVERAFEEFEAEVEVNNPHWDEAFRRRFVASEIEIALETLEAAGVAVWNNEVELRHGSDAPVRGTVTLTPAGRWVLHRHLGEAHDIDLPAGRPAQFADLGFEAMLEACEALALDGVSQVIQEITAWLDQRGDDAVDELLEVARTTADPGVQSMALAVLGEELGPEAEPAVRSLLDAYGCRAVALLWLVDHECEPPEVLLDPDPAVFADVLALVLASRGPDQMVDVFEHIGDHDAQLALLQVLWRLPSPSLAVVLHVLGRSHPSAGIAKAARKAAMQHRSHQANVRP